MDNFDLRKYLAENKLLKEEKYSIGDKLETYGGGEEVTVIGIKPNLEAALNDIDNPEAVGLLRKAMRQDFINREDRNQPFYFVEFEDGTPSRYWVESELVNQNFELSENKLLKEEHTSIDLFKKFKEEDILDDRREYDVEDLMSSYPGLSKEEAKKLFGMLQNIDENKLLKEHSVSMAGGIVTGGGFVGMDYMDYYGLHEIDPKGMDASKDASGEIDKNFKSIKSTIDSIELEEDDLDAELIDLDTGPDEDMDALATAAEDAYDSGMEIEEIIEFIRQHLGLKFGDY